MVGVETRESGHIWVSVELSGLIDEGGRGIPRMTHTFVFLNSRKVNGYCSEQELVGRAGNRFIVEYNLKFVFGLSSR